LAERTSHIIRFEAAGAALHAGLLVDQLPGERGTFTAELLEASFSAGSLYYPRTRVVSLEQTHNLAGGTVWPLDRWREVGTTAHRLGAVVHVDGARLLNAVTASGVAADVWAAEADSIWIDFSKGLGAPMGAVLAGSAAFVEEARRVKHQFGAGLRQSGIVTAACLYALDHHVERLADDHANALRLAKGLEALGLRPDPLPETNIVYVDPSPCGLDAASFCAGLAERGVVMTPIGNRFRAVTHLDVSEADIDRALEAAAAVLSGPGAKSER
jgi:threonine aldolase